MVGAMRALLVAMLPLVALANPMPEVVKSAIRKRADICPYIIESACRTPDKWFDEINRFERMSNAVIGARNLAKGAHDEWWLAGKHNEVAET
jgi:hypothetical protein